MLRKEGNEGGERKEAGKNRPARRRTERGKSTSLDGRRTGGRLLVFGREEIG